MTLAEHSRCSNAALKLVGDYWVLRIVEELSLSEKGSRFSELQRSLGGASPATLSNRLRRLEVQGLVDRDDAPGKLCVVYTLNERGNRVLPVIRAITDFATAE
ncbi:MAG TPA: helix-turn-helix domain-containing protein [Galbitalea sp.]|jgi:DNA-binding HxlR family transcriptional regulator|nr:helix-turn-helix domain-containing protein [Galbitalea sp.]